MHQKINCPDISKVYPCVFRPVKGPMRTLYKHISLKLMVKFISLRLKENVHRNTHVLTGLMLAPSVIIVLITKR